MTTQRDAIAGLRDRLLAEIDQPIAYRDDATLREASTQLDALREERDAMQARVGVFEVDLNGTIERSKTLLDAKNHWMDRALRAEQERDEAYELAAKAIDVEFDRQRIREDATHGFSYDRRQPANRAVSDALRKAADLVRSLAACPEKEKK
jgi:hypothetical protein